MQQHAVPQQISSYQFRLVGDMTLKQFFELAGGALIGILIYATPLPGIIKWPLIVIFILIGAALAFLPLEERPLEQWVFAFFRSVYSPTSFVWKQEENTVFFQPEEASKNGEKHSANIQGEITISQPTGTILNLEETEKSLLSKFSSIFHSFAAPVARETHQAFPSAVAAQSAAAQKTVFTDQITRVGVTAGVAGPIFEKKQEEKPQEQVVLEQVGQAVEGQDKLGGTAAQFSPQAAPPIPPEQPNLVVGQVMGPDGEIVEKAILEIRDDQGRPVRALRSNNVGHFMIVTPLLNGKYELAVEKEGYKFDPLVFEVKGEIVHPIAVRATQKLNLEEEHETT